MECVGVEREVRVAATRRCVMELSRCVYHSTHPAPHPSRSWDPMATFASSAGLRAASGQVVTPSNSVPHLRAGRRLRLAAWLARCAQCFVPQLLAAISSKRNIGVRPLQQPFPGLGWAVTPKTGLFGRSKNNDEAVQLQASNLLTIWLKSQ
jgi:hypothetical protein